MKTKSKKRELMRDAVKIADQVLHGITDRGEEFTKAEWRAKTRPKLRHMADEAFDGFLDFVIETADRRAAREPDRKQGLLPGFDFDLDGIYRLGDSKRIAKKDAKLIHIRQAVEIDDQNVASVTKANERKKEELKRLLKYLERGMTKGQAVEAYRIDHPDGEDHP